MCALDNGDFQTRALALERASIAIGSGLLLVDTQGREFYVSQRTRDRMADWPMALVNQVLILQDPGEHAVLQKKLALMQHQAEIEDTHLLKRGEDNPPIFLKIFNPQIEGLVGVMVRDPWFAADTDKATLGSLFQTTKRESQLAIHLSRGNSLLEFATANNLAMNTVKTHLKQVFKKTGVKSQMQLVSVVLTALR